MKTTIVALATSLTLSVTALAESRTLTLTANLNDGSTNATLVIQPYETVEVVSCAMKVDNNMYSSRWHILKNGLKIEPFNGNIGFYPNMPVIVAGPAVLTVDVVPNWFERNWVTVRITPETYPANDAIVVPAGPYGATVNLQSSTNLLNWTTISSFSYTNEPTSQFFRVRLDAAATVSGQQQPAPAFIKGVDMKK